MALLISLWYCSPPGLRAWGSIASCMRITTSKVILSCPGQLWLRVWATNSRSHGCRCRALDSNETHTRVKTDSRRRHVLHNILYDCQEMCFFEVLWYPEWHAKMCSVQILQQGSTDGRVSGAFHVRVSRPRSASGTRLIDRIWATSSNVAYTRTSVQTNVVSAGECHGFKAYGY